MLGIEVDFIYDKTTVYKRMSNLPRVGDLVRVSGESTVRPVKMVVRPIDLANECAIVFLGVPVEIDIVLGESEDGN